MSALRMIEPVRDAAARWVEMNMTWAPDRQGWLLVEPLAVGQFARPFANHLPGWAAANLGSNEGRGGKTMDARKSPWSEVTDGDRLERILRPERGVPPRPVRPLPGRSGQRRS